MSTLRRRLFGGDDSPLGTSREPTPDPNAKGEQYRVVPAEKLHKLTSKPRGSKRWNFWIFGLGGLFGLVMAAFFANSNDMIDLASLADVNLDSIVDILPAGLVKDAQDLQVGNFTPELWSQLSPLLFVLSASPFVLLHPLGRGHSG